MRRPRSAKVAARLTVVVVLPLPPLLFDSAIVRTSAFALDATDEPVEELVCDRRDAAGARSRKSGAVSPVAAVGTPPSRPASRELHRAPIVELPAGFLRARKVPPSWAHPSRPEVSGTRSRWVGRARGRRGRRSQRSPELHCGLVGPPLGSVELGGLGRPDPEPGNETTRGAACPPNASPTDRRAVARLARGRRA